LDGKRCAEREKGLAGTAAESFQSARVVENGGKIVHELVGRARAGRKSFVGEQANRCI
jgi:hypothetical protein